MRNIRDYFKSKNTLIDERNALERKLQEAGRNLRAAHEAQAHATTELIWFRQDRDSLRAEVESLDNFHRYLSQNIEDFDSYTIDYYDRSQQ